MITKEFLTAGSAYFTVSSPRNGGRHFTYWIRSWNPAEGHPDSRPMYLAHVLTGIDNTKDYTYMGKLNLSDLSLQETAKSGISRSALSWLVLDWALCRIRQGGELPPGYKIEHCGRCGRCGRMLTTPESIERGIGPECWEKMGLNSMGGGKKE